MDKIVVEMIILTEMSEWSMTNSSVHLKQWFDANDIVELTS